jgi:anti-anti-sigma regulatory factor
VDCGGVTDCDLPGLSALLALRHRADALDIELDISPVSTELGTLMEQTGVGGYLRGTSTEEAPGVPGARHRQAR